MEPEYSVALFVSVPFAIARRIRQGVSDQCPDIERPTAAHARLSIEAIYHEYRQTCRQHTPPASAHQVVRI